MSFLAGLWGEYSGAARLPPQVVRLGMVDSTADWDWGWWTVLRVETKVSAMVERKIAEGHASLEPWVQNDRGRGEKGRVYTCPVHGK